MWFLTCGWSRGDHCHVATEPHRPNRPGLGAERNRRFVGHNEGAVPPEVGKVRKLIRTVDLLIEGSSLT